MNLGKLVRESLAISAFGTMPTWVQKGTLKAVSFSPDADFENWAKHMDRKYFDFFDVNKNGLITTEEIHE